MNTHKASIVASAGISDFIARWRESGAAERANYALFLVELCGVLDLPPYGPPPAGQITEIAHEVRMGYRVPVQLHKPPLLVCAVRLFATLNSPTYEAIVGYPRKWPPK